MHGPSIKQIKQNFVICSCIPLRLILMINDLNICHICHRPPSSILHGNDHDLTNPQHKVVLHLMVNRDVMGQCFGEVADERE